MALETLDRCAIHSITTKPLELETAIERYAAAGVRGITLWEDAVAGRDPAAVRSRIVDAGLELVSLARGGFFVAPDADDRAAAIEKNRALIRLGAKLGAPSLVLVCGAHPEVALPEAREQITEAIGVLADEAEESGVNLSVEPLHPMYAGDRSAVNNIAQANEICDHINHPRVGVAVDVYHLWWDPDLETGIRRCGEAGRIFAFHVCDWRVPTEDLLWDRGLMGEGCIDIPQIRGWVEEAGFRGFNEVEIFSTRHWARNQDEFLSDIVRAYRDYV